MRAGTEVKSVGPLTSWDIFIQGYRRAQQLADDKNELERIAKAAQWQQTFDFRKQLFLYSKTILVTTPAQKIIYASSNLFTMNGYMPHEVIGHTPRIFQGKETEEGSRTVVRDSIKEAKPFESVIINYRKDGSLYKCHINGYPLFNKSKQLVHFIAFENVA
jgi:PAS domain S-box-containing protein